MSEQALVSYAQNGEDVVLWRALGHVREGRYIDVGACDPVELSVTKALYDRGWRGLDIDAVPEYVEALREARPHNDVVHAAITDLPVAEITFHQLLDTGLSTLLAATAFEHERAGFELRDIVVPASTLDAVCERSPLASGEIHLLKVDVEGAETQVLRSFALSRWRPWVVVVEATRPLSTELSYAEWDPILTNAGYTFALFDGVSRFYVAPDHAELLPALSYPACVLDDYVPVRQHLQDLRVDALTGELAAARRDAGRWRKESVTYWANGVAKAQRSEQDAKTARAAATQAERQLVRARTTLQEVRDDRKRLRAKVQRMTARIDRLSRRVEQLSDRFGTGATAPGRRSRSAVRAALARVMRTSKS